MKAFFKSIFLLNRIYYAISIELLLLIIGFFVPWVYILSQYLLLALGLFVLTDILILYRNKNGFTAGRETTDKLSNGDVNPIYINLKNNYLFETAVVVIDELPFQFQIRDLQFQLKLKSGEAKKLSYDVRPVKRGEYSFGGVNVFVSSPIGLIQKRYTFSNEMNVPVYPSFIQMRKYELLAISNQLMLSGIKKIRKIGSNAEFDQVKEYVQGDEYRKINWKATARKNRLMVNQYQDEKSQAVYSVIDMGRVMKMPFEELSLLDYAINASLVISNIALLKQDRAGIITFSHKVQSVLPAERRNAQMHKILELLYNQKTAYLESDFERLYIQVKRTVPHRSLLLLYTNFESLTAMQRQLNYLRRLAKDHLLVVIFFENTELVEFASKNADTTEEIYNKVVAEKFVYEKRIIVRELEKYGIHSILTSPQKLSINTINKYMELKARGLI
ncbi:MAG TPA: DUF58 domain-containing protein [Bacteroidia bacterium]|jgi:uncharacterized protein (DUF58 family)|nr:DUF58 domain-containing protein [Bacteroidia bacterium]